MKEHVFGFLIAVASANAQTVVPGSATLIEGNSGSDTPFNQTGVRMQQVYRASQFMFGSEANGGWIRSIAFRVDGPPGSGEQRFSATLPSVQISFSTTQRQPDSLSPVFAENIGADATLVYSGSLMLQGSTFPPAPHPFDIRIHPTTAFFYDPRQGNLLMDVRNYMGASTATFDAVNTLGDPVSMLFSIGADSTSGTLSTLGLVTAFGIEAVPEPSTWALLVAGLAALRVFRRRQQAKP